MLFVLGTTMVLPRRAHAIAIDQMDGVLRTLCSLYTIELDLRDMEITSLKVRVVGRSHRGCVVVCSAALNALLRGQCLLTEATIGRYHLALEMGHFRKNSNSRNLKTRAKKPSKTPEWPISLKILNCLG